MIILWQEELADSAEKEELEEEMDQPYKFI